MLQTLVLYMPEPGSPVAGTLSVILAITIAFWDPILLFFRQVRYQPIMVIEENWKRLLHAHREEVGSEVTLDEFLVTRARSDPNIIREVQGRVSGEVWFLIRNKRDGLARVPVEDILEGLKEAA